jgi:type II secretory pathway component GspD/PulD (secretin)
MSALLTLLGQMSMADDRPEARPLTPSYYIVEAELSQIIERLAIESGLTPVLEGITSAKVSTMKLSGTASEMLADLSADQELDILQYNGVLYVSSTDLRSTRLLQREGFSAENVMTIIEGSGIPTAAYRVRQNEGSNSVVVTASPSTLGLLEALLESAGSIQQFLSDPIIVRRGLEVSLVNPDGSPYLYVSE